MAVQAERFDDPKRFFDAVRPAFEPREIEASLFLGTAREMAETGAAGFMLVVRSEAGPAAAALRKRPHLLSIASPEGDGIEDLSLAVVATGEPVPGVIGLVEHAQHFAEHWCGRRGQAPRPPLTLAFMTLRAVVPPPSPAPGRLRQAEAADQDWLTDWTVAFAKETGLPAFEAERAHCAAIVREKIAAARQFVWEHEGRPVSILAFAHTGLGGARIGAVMTDPAERGKGFASAAVAALSQHVLDSGKRWASLFADVANPLSNRIYRRLGYRDACRFASIEFAAAEAERQSPMSARA